MSPVIKFPEILQSRKSKHGKTGRDGLSYPLLVFFMLYYSVMLILAAYLNIWEDEVYSLNTSSGGPAYAFKQSFEFELQPPVYFLLLTIWRTVSGSIFWARLLSVILIFLSQLLLYRFIEERTDKKTAGFFTVLFLLNPLVIYAGLEIRTFALVLFLSLAIVVSFSNIYFTNRISVRNRIFFIILAIAGLFTQYFIGFLLFANSIVLLAGRKWKSLGIYIADMIIPLFLLMLLIPVIFSGAGLQADSFPEYSGQLKIFSLKLKDWQVRLPMVFFFLWILQIRKYYKRYSKPDF